MTRARVAGVVFAAVLVLLVLLALAVAVGHRALDRDAHPAAESSLVITPSASLAAGVTHPEMETFQGFLYGRITTVDGAILEGRLRWGRGEEAFWSDSFNGAKHENPWLSQVPPGALPAERYPVEIFGFEIFHRERQIALGRPFMARFGEIVRIEAHGVEVRVILKSGTVFDLNRLDASDFDDDVRVWDGTRGVVDLDSLRIRSIEFLPTLSPGAVPGRLHGTVHTRQGDFTGFVQWDRSDCVGTDELVGHTFDTIRSIARASRDSSLVTLLDGREILLSGSREAGRGNLGISVDDRRYGRVLISWDAFERVDFSPGGSGPAYGDFPPGSPLTGSVTTRAGRRLAGRLVYDLDESETTETLDAPSSGVDYTLPLGLVASIVTPGREEPVATRVQVTLQDGEELQLERKGDLGEGNAGMLIFVDGGRGPEYVPWADVERIDFDHPLAMYPAPGGR